MRDLKNCIYWHNSTQHMTTHTLPLQLTDWIFPVGKFIKNCMHWYDNNAWHTDITTYRLNWPTGQFRETLGLPKSIREQQFSTHLTYIFKVSTKEIKKSCIREMKKRKSKKNKQHASYVAFYLLLVTCRRSITLIAKAISPTKINSKHKKFQHLLGGKIGPLGLQLYQCALWPEVSSPSGSLVFRRGQTNRQPTACATYRLNFPRGQCYENPNIYLENCTNRYLCMALHKIYLNGVHYQYIPS